MLNSICWISLKTICTVSDRTALQSIQKCQNGIKGSFLGWRSAQSEHNPDALWPVNGRLDLVICTRFVGSCSWSPLSPLRSPELDKLLHNLCCSTNTSAVTLYYSLVTFLAVWWSQAQQSWTNKQFRMIFAKGVKTALLQGGFLSAIARIT